MKDQKEYEELAQEIHEEHRKLKDKRSKIFFIGYEHQIKEDGSLRDDDAVSVQDN